MLGNLPKKLLTWTEPRVFRAAAREAAIRRMGLSGYVRRRLRHAAFFGSGFLILVLIPLFTGRNVLPWCGIVSLPIFCGILLAYFVALVVRLMPQEVRITDRGVQQQAGPGWRIFPWERIGRVELIETLVDGRRCRLVLLHPPDPTATDDGEPTDAPGRSAADGNVQPVVIGVGEKVDGAKLEAVISEQGPSVTRTDQGGTGGAVDWAFEGDERVAAARPPTWIVDAAMILLLMLSAMTSCVALRAAH